MNRYIATAFFVLLTLPGRSQAVVITSGCVNANISCSLLELTSGGSITVDNLLFSGWDTSQSAGVDFTKIFVSGINDPYNPGLLYTTNGGLQAGIGTPGVSSSSVNLYFDFNISTSVSEQISGYSFEVIDVNFTDSTGSTISPTSGLNFEQLYPTPTSVISYNNRIELNVETGGASMDIISISDNFGGDSVGTVYNNQPSGNSSLTLNAFSQNFSLTPVPAVPVPAAFWLFGSGLIGLTGLARRKKS